MVKEARAEDEDKNEDENGGSNKAGGAQDRLSNASNLTYMVSEEKVSKTRKLMSEDVISRDAEGAEVATTLNTGFERTAIGGQEEDTIMMSSQNETTPTSPSSEPSLDSILVELTESDVDHDKMALAGLRCPLCICPINGMYFPTIQCLDCDRIYHQVCIQYNRSERYYPFRDEEASDPNRCKGCWYPGGDSCCIYVGHPGIMFHRRDQDPDFEEYFRRGQLEEAKSGDLC